MSGENRKHGNVAVFVPHIGCPHRCSFCDQRTISGEKNAPTPQFVEDTCREAIEMANGRELELAFFGGSFTAIDKGYMLSLIDAAAPFVGKGICGIRMSTRPDAVGEEMLKLLKTYPVTAIELGAQSLNDEVLRKNRRGHTAQDVIDASERIKRFGFELGLQMMIGLDGESEQDCYDTAEKMIACRPDTLRIYPALIIEGTELAIRLKKGEYKALTLEEGIERTSKVMEMFMEKAPDTKIIRVGLHTSKELEENLLAGPYHPAFRELCESRIMLKRLIGKLEGVPKGEITVRVNPADISRMLGQKRQNAETLRQMGYIIKLKADKLIAPLDMAL
ncbi:MAG: radical SAM protein [Oscillospiraceae bacterium]|nr:radical SAM protein [Oscillospiraceae bacterium]MBP1557570.1 radical SAM protein [Oscillospiraceae bacterium]